MPLQFLRRHLLYKRSHSYNIKQKKRCIKLEEYIYKNILKNCPNCGAELSENDKECPACSANLIGYNEEYNRAQNLKKSANELNEIAQKRENIKKKNEIENKKKKKAKYIAYAIFGICFALILSFIIGIELAENSDEYKNIGKGKTYEQIKEQLNETGKMENIIIDVVSEIDTKQIDYKTDKFSRDFVNRYQYSMGYNKENETTVISHIYNNTEYEYELNFYYNSNVVYIPNAEMSLNRLSFDTRKNGIRCAQTFEETVSNITIDEYFLENFVKEQNNIIWKYGNVTVKQEQTMFNNTSDLNFIVYVIEKAGNSDYPKVVVLSKLDDNTMYEIQIHTYNSEDALYIADNIEEFLQIRYKRSFVGNLD